MTRGTLGAGLVAALLVTASAADAQTRPAAGAQPGRPGAPTSSGRITRLGTADAFYRRVQTLDAVRRMAADRAVQRRLSQVMDGAGLTGLTSQVLAILGNPDPQRMVEVRIEPGTRMEWMAFRAGTRGRLQRPAVWAGRQPFEAWRFTIEDAGTRYNFLLPKACGNLALLNQEAIPPPPTAKPDDSAERLRREQAERERAERERLERERLQAKAEEERRAREAEEAKRAAAEQAERDRLEQERLARLAREKVDWFVAGYGGKERRVRDEEIALGNGSTIVVQNGQCAGLIGAKGGLDVRLSPSWRMAPAVGVAFNLEDGDNMSLFADLEFNYHLPRGYLGTGVGVWDFNHGDDVAATWLVHGGWEVYRHANDNRLFFALEGRFFLNELDDTSNNYQFWGGLRYVIR